jgi:hypothetical protein
MGRTHSITAIVLLFLFLVALPARADFVIHHWENHYEPVHSLTLEGDLLYYTTNQNYDLQANPIPASNSDTYKRLEIDATGQFGIIDRFSLFGRLTWAHIETNNSIADSTNSSFADQTVGGTFRAYESAPARGRWVPISLDLQGTSRFSGLFHFGG